MDGLHYIETLHRASQIGTKIFADLIGTEHDITPRQAQVLAVVWEAESVDRKMSQTDIVEVTKIDRSTLADVVKRLTKKGLLNRRRRKEDARAYQVSLTDKGKAIAGKVARASTKIAQEIQEMVPNVERLKIVNGSGA